MFTNWKKVVKNLTAALVDSDVVVLVPGKTHDLPNRLFADRLDGLMEVGEALNGAIMLPWAYRDNKEIVFIVVSFNPEVAWAKFTELASALFNQMYSNNTASYTPEEVAQRINDVNAPRLKMQEELNIELPEFTWNGVVVIKH